jgi:hypothetical protein
MSFFASIASGGVGAIMSGIGTLAKDLRQAIVGSEMQPEQKVALEMKIMELEQASVVAQMEMIKAEASSADPWTSRARPMFMYVFYSILLLMGIVAPIVGIFFAAESAQFYTNVAAGFKAIPSDLYALFGAGYLGYAGFRSFEKVKGAAK